IVLTNETTDTKIQKRPRIKTCRKKNENSTTTLLEELASEAISSSQVEPEFCQKEYEEREKEKNKVDDDGERVEEVDEEKGKKEDEEQEGNKKEFEEDKGKQKEVEEEEGKNKEVVEEEEEKINDVDEEKGKRKEVEEEEQEKNEVESDDGIKTINAHTFPVHLQPNATGDSIMRSTMGKLFDTFRIMLKQKGLKDFFRNSCFGHFLDLLKKNIARFQMTMVYELLKRRIEFAIVSGLKCHPPSESIPEFIVKKKPQRQKKGEKEETRQSTEEQDLVSLVDRVKMELVGARTIKRDRVDNELVVFDGVDGDGIDVGAGVDVGGDIGAGAGQDQWATSCKRCSGFLCEKCKKQDEDSIMYLQTLSQTVNEFKNKRGVKVISSKKVQHPYTPQEKKRKKSFINAIQNLKKKIFGELSMVVGEEVLKFKHVNVYKRMPIAQKNKLIELMRGKELSAKYGMHEFSGEDFKTMTSMKIWWEDWHVRYPEYYDSTNRILDLNFYSNFKQRYGKMSENATTVGGRSFTQLINEFEWNEDMINYVRGIRLYPEGMD
ncbi:hypothetical protein KY284_032377, partial [Solanum tuberosum]